MNNEFHKPYLAELCHTEPAVRFYVYPREALCAEPIFPYLVLDGGAFFLMTDYLGDAGSDTLLDATLSGRLFDFFRDPSGALDWCRGYHRSAETGMPKNHEQQSWPQRLYMLLPLAQKYLITAEPRYAREWLRILRLWTSDSPYEPLRTEVAHTDTSMKWRDMQVSWRTCTLIYSLYMLGSHPGAFTREEWAELYAFLDLNLSHLVADGRRSLQKGLLGNHTLQMGSALVSGGIEFAELPRAREYFSAGMDILRACFEKNVMPDGGTREVGPSYNHFIARLYLEAQKNCELNAYPELPGLHDSVIRQYQWLAAVARRDGRALRLSDAYGMDAHADVRRMAEIFPFTPDFSKRSVRMQPSEYILLRNPHWELALDAMPFYGGHQHYGRIQPLLWKDGEEILTDTGCCNYDRYDLYVWGMTAEAHSVVTCPELPLYTSSYDVRVLRFSAEENRVTARMRVSCGDRSYVWTRSVALGETGAEFTDHVEATGVMTFQGRWYLPGRPTALSEGSAAQGCSVPGAIYITEGRVARQSLAHGPLVVESSLPMRLDRTAAMDDENRPAFLARLTWTHTGRDFTVRTRFSY